MFFLCFGGGCGSPICFIGSWFIRERETFPLPLKICEDETRLIFFSTFSPVILLSSRRQESVLLLLTQTVCRVFLFRKACSTVCTYEASAFPNAREEDSLLFPSLFHFFPSFLCHSSLATGEEEEGKSLFLLCRAAVKRRKERVPLFSTRRR